MQLTVETKQASIIFQLMPLNAVEPFEVINDSDEEGAWSLIEYGLVNEDEESGFYGEIETQEIELPSHGDWKLLGSPFSLTEEQWQTLVDYSEMADMGIDDIEGGYLCYLRNHWFHKTATEAGKSLLVANKIYQELYNSAMWQWEDVPSRTGNWVVLVNYKSNG